MRTRMMLGLVGLFGLVTLAAAQNNSPTRGQPGTGKGKPAARTTSKSALEKALEQALASNPDLKVAQAKASEAEAQLNRTRLQVLQKVVNAYQTIEQSRVAVTAASGRLEYLKKLGDRIKTAVSADDLRAAEVALSGARMAMEKARADLDFLVGKVPPGLGLETGRGPALGYFPSLGLVGGRASLSGFSMQQGMGGLGGFGQPSLGSLSGQSAYDLLVFGLPIPAKGPRADHIRRAMEKKVGLSFKDTPARDVLELLRKEVGDLHIQATTRDDPWSEKMTANLKYVSFAAALQLLEDALGGHRVVVREYGLLIVPLGKVPPGAMLLDNFLKSKPEAKKEKAPVRR